MRTTQRRREAYLISSQIVFNPSTYPNFINFLKFDEDLRSAILPTEMTFSVSRDHGIFEWAGNTLFTVFTQPSRLLDPSMWRLLYDVLRFNACARRIAMRQPKDKVTLSIGEYLKREEYSDTFRDNYLIVQLCPFRIRIRESDDIYS